MVIKLYKPIAKKSAISFHSVSFSSLAFLPYFFVIPRPAQLLPQVGYGELAEMI